MNNEYEVMIMSNIFMSIKNFVKGVFVQEESIGLKGLEKIKLNSEVLLPKRGGDYKISDIMKL